MPAESALVVLVPEAEGLVRSFRDRHDPAAAAGVPAHITILYPFKEPRELTPEVLRDLADLFAHVPGFDVSLRECRHFPGVLYLAPEPAEPVCHLTEIVAAHYPENPPYGGRFAEIIPHLTVAHEEDELRMAEITAQLHHAALDYFPIHAPVRTVTLMESRDGHWRISRRFPLAE
ncbi:MAG TPA: 2'-5' RNA ligase family protein [Candidatus Kapabacteria bacterium]|nr:2'-5' RNA ligase family protein [Candidatus Kapabacteria bacterium]